MSHCFQDYYSEMFHSTHSIAGYVSEGPLLFPACDPCCDPVLRPLPRFCTDMESIRGIQHAGANVCCPPFKMNLDYLKLSRWDIPVITHVPRPAECWLNIFSLFVSHAPFSRTNTTSLRSTHSLAWSWWRSMWNLWRRGQRLSKTMPNNWGRPRSLSSFCCAVCLKFLCHSVRLRVFAWVHVKRLFVKCLRRLMTTLGQNRTCLWNTGLILQLQCARSLPLSLSVHGAPSPSCLPVGRPTSVVVLSFAGEERKWEQTGTW